MFTMVSDANRRHNQKLKKEYCTQIVSKQKKSHDLSQLLDNQVGVTGFEPATTRPPDVYATGLRHTPMEAIFILFTAKLSPVQ
jgi:hypothetical protein